MIGRTLGTYRIIEKIGMGGMATVYKAYDANTDRHVAVKILPEYHSKDSEFYERFRREARAIAKLEHINILPVHAYGEEEGIAYLVMRYLPTGTLSDRIRQGKIPYDEISRLLKQIASALDYAHEQGVLHRDVKPSNVLLDERGNAYLTDFGLARMVESTSDLTGSNMLGTPQYMSPEQCQGRKDITAASDIYSLGVVLYEMVTGETPFQAETPLAVIHMQLSEPLPPPRSLRPDVPEAVESVIYKAMAKQPDARHKTCMAMSDAFDKAIATIPQPQPPKQAAPDDPDTVVGKKMVQLADEQTAVLPKTKVTAPPLQRQFPVWAAVVAVVVVLGVLALLASGILNPPTTPTPTQSTVAEATSELTEAASQTPTEAQTEAVTELATEDSNVAIAATPVPTTAADQSVRVINENQAMLSVAFSNDGRWLVSGGADNTLRIYDVATGEELINIPLGEEQFAIALAFSPDGRFLAAGGLDVRLSVADTLTDASASPINILAGGVVRGVAFSPNSQYLIYGGDNQVLEVYRVNNGTDAELMHQLEGHVSGVTGVAFSPDGELMATAGGYEDGQVLLWELSTHASTALTTGGEFVDAVAFSPDGLRLAVSTGGLLQIWNVVTGTLLMNINAGAYAATYSPDGRLIATTYDGGMISLVNAETFEEVAQLSGHTITSRDIAFSPDGTLLASASEDGIRLWSVSQYAEGIPMPEPLPTAEVTSTEVEVNATMLDIERNTLGVDYGPGGNRIVFGAADGAVRLWTPSIGELLTLSAGDEIVSNAVFSPNGVLMASAGNDAVRIWDLRTNRQVFVVPGEGVKALAFSVDNQTFAFADANNVVHVWTLLRNEQVYAFDDATAEIGGLSFSPNGTQLAVSGGYGDGQIRLYNMNSGDIASTIDINSSAAYGITYSPSGELIAVGDSNNSVMILDAATGEQITTLANPAYTWSFSPDSTMIAAGGEDSNIYLYDARTGEQIRTISGHTQRIESLSFSPDGTHLVSTSEDATVRIWDLAGDD